MKDTGGENRALALIRDEALAYLKLALLAPLRHRIVEDSVEGPDLGVLFVPGIGANGGQFLALKEALRPYGRSFDAFEYWSLRDPRRTAVRLAEHIGRLRTRCASVLLVTHSLGGVLGRLVLQADEPPPVAGFVAICSPLQGTWRSRLAPHRHLRALAPDTPLMTRLAATAHRLKPLGDRVLTIGTTTDQFIEPKSSAFLDGHPTLVLEGVAHAGSLFDRRVLDRVAELAGSIGSATPPRPRADLGPRPVKGATGAKEGLQIADAGAALE